MDLAVLETGNGGDLQLKGNDLAMVFGYENNVYLALFGGNVEQVTPPNRVPGTEDFSWWGNRLLMPSNQSNQFNSITERTLKTTPLTSAGRLIIENAVKKDLEFMAAFAKVKVDVVIVATDVVNINIETRQLDGQPSITIITYNPTTGDFNIDFNNDFFI
jgi:hypothetical protein